MVPKNILMMSVWWEVCYVVGGRHKVDSSTSMDGNTIKNAAINWIDGRNTRAVITITLT